MDYTSIHVYGHLLSDDILNSVERDSTLIGNREQDFGVDSRVSQAIDYAWSSLRNDWRFFKERSLLNDPYGTRRSRDLMERFLANLGYHLERQTSFININGKGHDITYLCEDLGNLPVIVVGDKTGDATIDTLDKCSLDFRAKGDRQRKSPHATMLEYLNNTENVYGIVANGQTIRLLRNTGQLVKLTYIEFDLRRMLDEDKYTEFCLLFRLLHASRFRISGDDACIFENWFNMSIASGNRIRDGLSDAVKKTMEIIGQAAIIGDGPGNDNLRQAILNKTFTSRQFNKELIHFIYRLLFLFIIEERNLVYQIPESSDADYDKLCRLQDIYKKYYAASRFRNLSELIYLQDRRYQDLWQSLMDTFRLFEPAGFGEKLGIKPLGGLLFDDDTLHYLKACSIDNEQFLQAFRALNEFIDDRCNRVKINYSSLDVEEFGSVYEGILEMQPYVNSAPTPTGWEFGYVGGLDRKSTSSYYTRPDLVQSLIRTTLEPVIKEKVAQYQTREEQVKALLAMKVCDAASGSGHIALAMARTLAWYVCSIRTGEDNPASLDYREALREVIQKCIYAVDFNPDAVELCKVVLWIEGYCAGMPLSFLDHHIRCGNSVVGITDLDVLLKGVPKEAFCSEDREVLRQIKALNNEALDEIKVLEADAEVSGSSGNLFTSEPMLERIDSEQIGLATKVKEITALPESTLLEELTKQRRWEDLMKSPRVECLRRACDIYTYAFYKQFTQSDIAAGEDLFAPSVSIPYTKTVYRALEEIKHLDEKNSEFKPLDDNFKNEVLSTSRKYRFFHWCIEFPEVFANEGGFDVMCGNPPWDKIKVEDKKWFEQHGRSDIVNAGTAAQRKKAIENLPNTDPELFQEYCQALQDAESMSRFVRFGGRFKLTATGDIDLYPMFAELCMSFTKDAWGLVLPTGIAVNDSNKAFFSKLIDENRLISLYDFENKEALFDIHRMFKFCLLTAGKKQSTVRTVKGGFYLTRLDHLLDPNRIYTIKTSDFALLNPNTKTCPVFRTSRDASLTTKIYSRTKILFNEKTNENPWNIKFSSMIHMSNESHFFRTYEQLNELGGTLDGNVFSLPSGKSYVPLYEGKMIWLYNHHYGSWPMVGERPNSIDEPSIECLSNPSDSIMPWYWVPESEVESRKIKTDNDGNIIWEWKHSYVMGFRDITNSTNERTFIISLIPAGVGVGNSTTLLYADGAVANTLALATASSLPFDYVTRQKIGGSHASISFVKQFPVIPFEDISKELQSKIIIRVAELTYFNHDLDGWAEELYDELTDEQKSKLPQLRDKTPFVFNPEHRAVLQAELDAIIGHLYGLNTEDMRYILDPEDVCGPGCINETFRVLKDNEIRQYGEYRTKRLVMDAWYRFGFNK